MSLKVFPHPVLYKMTPREFAVVRREIEELITQLRKNIAPELRQKLLRKLLKRVRDRSQPRHGRDVDAEEYRFN